MYTVTLSIRYVTITITTITFTLLLNHSVIFHFHPKPTCYQEIFLASEYLFCLILDFNE